MIYGLRINDHSGDHADLLLNAVRPALITVNAAFGPHGLAIKSHWANGPHVLLALSARTQPTPDIWIMLSESLKPWCTKPVTYAALDPIAYRGLSRSLAAAEHLDIADPGLQPDKTIVPGKHFVADFLDDPGLSRIRDHFKSEIVDHVFAMIAERQKSPMGGLVEMVVRLSFLDRIQWHGSSAIWPMSINAQAQATRRVEPAADALFENVSNRVTFRLRERILQAGALDPSFGLSEHYRSWVTHLQNLHDTIKKYVDGLDITYFNNFRDRSLQRDPNAIRNIGLDSRQYSNLVGNKEYFVYRVIINMLYEIFPTIGFSPTHRIFSCRLCIDTIKALKPQLVIEMSDLAKSLIRQDSHNV